MSNENDKIENQEITIEIENKKTKKKGSKAYAIIVTILVIILGLVVAGIFVIKNNIDDIKYKIEEIRGPYKFSVPDTSLKLTIHPGMKLYKTYEEISKLMDDEDANFAFVLSSKDGDVELYGTVINKATYSKEYTLDEIAMVDRQAIIKEGYIPEKVSDAKFGNVSFKTYSYTNTNLVHVYITESGDKFVYIDAYCKPESNDKVEELLEKLFTK